eukprot:COSAG06_NODE_938_length_11391_cov_13.363974_6_plen_354_part_00
MAKADQARQKEGKVSDGETRPNREPTDEEKKMLEEKLQKFFTANTPGQFKRKEAARPRSTVPDKTGFDAVQAAIKELVDQKRLGTAGAAEAAAAAAAAGAELEPQPLPQPQQLLEDDEQQQQQQGEATGGKKAAKLSRRQRAAAANKLKAEQKSIDSGSAAAAASMEQKGSKSSADEPPPPHPAADAVCSDLQSAEEKRAELDTLRQAVVDAQARLDAFLQTHGAIDETRPASHEVSEPKDTAAAEKKEREACAAEPPAVASPASTREDKEETGGGRGGSPTVGSPYASGRAPALETAGPMTRLIEAATQQEEQRQHKQQTLPLTPPTMSKTKKLKPTHKQDVLAALKQMKEE